MRKRDNRIGLGLMIVGVSLLYLFSTGFVSGLLIKPLESRHMPLMGKVEADGIVILTSGVKDLSHIGLGPHPDEASIERLVEGYRIYREMGIRLVIISGGKADPAKPDISIGAAMARVALEMGMPEKDLILEDNSINTYGGALEVAKIFGPSHKRIILVTSAWHMPRSAKLYRKAGFEVIVAPTGFNGGEGRISLYSFIPTAGSLGISSTALYEYLSTGWYLLKGTL